MLNYRFVERFYSVYAVDVIIRAIKEIRTVMIDDSTHNKLLGNSLLSFNLLDLYVRVIQAGSFSAVASQRNVAVSSVSRQIRKLEEIVSTTLLLKHGSNKLVPTEAGWYLYNKAQLILETWQDVQDGMQESLSKPKGNIRVGCSTPVGETLLVKLLPAFLKSNPEIHIELYMKDTYVDVIVVTEKNQ